MSAKSRSGIRWAILGMGAVCAGRKWSGAALFARGIALLEEHWRTEHPEFRGGFRERWALATEFYEETHTNQLNRWMHIAGIPLIAAGTVGLLAARPYRSAWAVSAGAFTAGWALNIAGHLVFEKNRPAFEQDPLSFVAGPLWDLQQLLQQFRPSHEPATQAASTASVPECAQPNGENASARTPPRASEAHSSPAPQAASAEQAPQESTDEPTTGVKYRTIIEA
jgi:hypothetical protein